MFLIMRKCIRLTRQHFDELPDVTMLEIWASEFAAADVVSGKRMRANEDGLVSPDKRRCGHTNKVGTLQRRRRTA